MFSSLGLLVVTVVIAGVIIWLLDQMDPFS